MTGFTDSNPGLAAESREASIHVSDAGRAVTVEPLDLEDVLGWLSGVLATEWPDAGEVSVMLQSDAEIQRLNREFRGRSGATDVLSFPDDQSNLEPRLGDIAVSLETASRQADEAGHSLTTEVKALLLHGVLHCLGYDHERDDGEMEQLELTLRERWLTSREGSGD